MAISRGMEKTTKEAEAEVGANGEASKTESFRVGAIPRWRR